MTEHRRRAMESGWKPVESVSGTSGVARCHGLAIVGVRRNEGGFGDSLNSGRYERGPFGHQERSAARKTQTEEKTQKRPEMLYFTKPHYNCGLVVNPGNKLGKAGATR
jgi:hypothetical protein